MTTRNLDALFAPRAIALIGASNQTGSLGAVLAKNLLESGFDGPILPVNPHEASIRSALAYRSVSDLPAAPDLAVIATPAATVPGLIADLGAKGCRAAVVITAGVTGPLRQQMLDAARPHLLRVLGPNCLGFISPCNGLNASFAHLTPRKGGVALVAQSGAVTTAALDWAHGRGYGFSRVATLGDTADIDFGDMLDFLALDNETKAILLYVESVTDARKFLTAGRIAGRTKPVVVIKAGRSASGAKAAFSHTGALAGADAVYDAAFHRAGMVRVDDLRELFDAVAILTAGVQVGGDRLAIVTNGGGAGVLAADALEAMGGRLAPLAATTVAALDRVLPATWSHGNPVDIIGDATPERYAAALEAVLAEPSADAVLVLSCPTAMTDSLAAAMAVTRTVRDAGQPPPTLTCWLGDPAAREARRHFAQAGLPSHETPHEAVRAFMHLAEHRRNQILLRETPPAGPEPADRAAAQTIVRAALEGGRVELTEPEAKAVLAAYGVPMVESVVVRDPAQAESAAKSFPGPYALKILSPDIVHKSDVGGVALSLPSGAAVREAGEAMLARIAEAAPGARIEGFVLQRMIRRPRALELIAGIATDPAFGPVILFGSGGVAVEAVGDRALGLPPLNRLLARDIIDRTRVARLLHGYRDVPAADLDAVAGVLERLAMLALELPNVAELDINPLLADAEGVIGLDARIKLTGTPVRPAITPYPEDLRRRAPLADGSEVEIRPVRPSDEPALLDLVEMTSHEVRVRFRGAFDAEAREMAARLSQIDYDREMVLIALDGAEGVGVARLAADPEGETAEFALLVRTDWQDRGVGMSLMQAIVDHARNRGLSEVWGEVDSGNARMLSLARSLKFRRGPAGEANLVRLALGL